MLYSDWLSHCTLLAISVQWLGVVDKITMIPSFSEVLNEHLEKKWVIKFLRRLKGGHLSFHELKKLEIFERKWKLLFI